ncbi:putative phosphoglycerate mutase [Actinoplanes lutulentus]|uniref:Putative phosphoglycerate mutase n=1 Tax=Actinoplanes lutulentus TaxID=1287878 RepID=A0A327ZL49_9ACTN|nr:phosphoglycerate mutase family protein [Actinoplanes lutulentus]MBB2942005.1 putative phosphoglycerate mutase [Actinoplanes lutulentus]RAK39917.1 putative phosphoglycerate mutase [Actinoplanes lutulentus]
MAVRHLWLVRHGEAVPDQSDLTEAGRQQASLLGARLAGLPLESISHSPKPRALRTAQIVARHFPDVPVREAEELDDQVPTDDPSVSAAMIARFTSPVADESHELVITHNFQVGWFLRDAYAAPPERFRVVNQCNTGVTLIRYPAGQVPRVILVNDLTHLPAELRWTGFPPELRP